MNLLIFFLFSHLHASTIESILNRAIAECIRVTKICSASSCAPVAKELVLQEKHSLDQRFSDQRLTS